MCRFTESYTACVFVDDVDDTGDVAQETQNFGLVLQTMDPASAAGNTLFNSFDISI